MRIHRPVRYLRRPPRSKYNQAHKNMSNIELNTQKTRQNYIYFDIVSQKTTDNFAKKRSTYINEIGHKYNNEDNIKLLNTDNKKINFICTQNTDENSKKAAEANTLSNITNSNINEQILSNKLNSAVFAYNNSGDQEITIHVGDSIPFSHLAANYGSSINQLNNAAFEINISGTFKITFILYTTKSSPLGGTEIVVDNVAIDSPTTLISPGSPLIGHGIFNLKDGNHTVKIVVSGLDLSLCTWKNASIIIEQLN